MFLPPQVMFGNERNWPEAFDNELPLFPRAIAKKAGLNPRTVRNSVKGKHAPSAATVALLATAFSKNLEAEISQQQVKIFLNLWKSSDLRSRGYWELAFQGAATGALLHGVKFFPYSRNVIVPQERAAIQHMRERITMGEISALRKWFGNPAIGLYLDALFREKNFDSWSCQELLWCYGQVFLRLHVSGIAALEAEANSQYAQDPGPALLKYMPAMKRGRIEGPVSRYLTEMRSRYGVGTDLALSERLAKNSDGDRESWRRQILRWRKAAPIPEWDSIEQILAALEVGEDRAMLLWSFAAVRYFQTVLDKMMSVEDGEVLRVDLEETVRLFGEYEIWYRLHAERIREGQSPEKGAAGQRMTPPRRDSLRD